MKGSPFKKRISKLEEMLADSHARGKDLAQRFVDYLVTASNPNETEVSVLNIRDHTLRMVDIALTIQRNVIVNLARRKDVFYQFTVKPDGTIVKVREDTLTEYPNKKLVGTIPDEEVKEYGGIGKILRMTQYIWTEDQELFRRALTGRLYTGREVSNFTNRISPSAFQNIAFMLTPRISVGSYLFSLNKEGNELYFSLDGKVTGIKRSPQ